MDFTMMTDDRLFEDARRTWALVRLWMLADEHDQVTASLQNLQTDWQLSRNTIAGLLRELEAGGYLERQTQAGRVTSYRLTGRGMQRVGEGPASSAVSVISGLPPGPSPEKGTAQAPRKKSPPSDASRLVHLHAERYTARFNQPFPVAWARDTQIYKRLIGVYGVDRVERFQDRYLAQPLDSFAAKRGFSIPQFAAEIGGLAAQEAMRHQLTSEQAEVGSMLQSAGMSEDTSLVLVSEYPLEQIRAQLQVHRWRQQKGQIASTHRLERAIREEWAVPDDARPIVYDRFPDQVSASVPGIDNQDWQVALSPLLEKVVKV